MELSEEEIKGVLAGALQCCQDVNLISYRLVSNAPNGFNGLYNTILIKYSVKNNEEKEEELSCFAKSVPTNEQHVAYIRGTALLHKEHEFFHKILPTFREFTNFDLPVPDCYFLRFDDGNDFARNVVVMQDLARQGFVTRDPKVGMNYKECSVVIQALAKLHAASFIVTQKGGINLSSFLTHTREALWTADEAHPAAKWIPSAIDTLMDVAQKPGCKFGRRVTGAGARQKLADAFSAARDLVAPSHKYANCVCHGDVWNNNVMLKYDDRGEAQAARLVDMQVYRLAPPITDVLMFLCLNVTRALRAQVMERLLLEYWQAVRRATRGAGCELPAEMADVEALLALADEFKLFGLVAAGGYVPMCQLPPEARRRDAATAVEGEHDFDVLKDFLNSRGEQVIRGMQMSDAFACRLEDTMEELFEFIGI